MREGSWVGEWDQRPAGQGRGGGCLLSGPFARLPMFSNISGEERGFSEPVLLSPGFPPA